MIGPGDEFFEPSHRFTIQTSVGTEEVSLIVRPFQQMWGEDVVGTPEALVCALNPSEEAYTLLSEELRQHSLLSVSHGAHRVIEEHFAIALLDGTSKWFRVTGRSNSLLTPGDIIREIDLVIAKMTISADPATSSQSTGSKLLDFEPIYERWFKLLERHFDLIEVVEHEVGGEQSLEESSAEETLTRRERTASAVYAWFGRTYSSGKSEAASEAATTPERIDDLSASLFAVVSEFWLLGSLPKRSSELYTATQKFFKLYPPPPAAKMEENI